MIQFNCTNLVYLWALPIIWFPIFFLNICPFMCFLVVYSTSVSVVSSLFLESIVQRPDLEAFYHLFVIHFELLVNSLTSFTSLLKFFLLRNCLILKYPVFSKLCCKVPLIIFVIFVVFILSIVPLVYNILDNLLTSNI